MSIKAKTKWTGNMSFEAEVNGHKFLIDADEKVGGKDKGPSPKPLLLVALAGCTGMDVISILNKMKVYPDGFNVDVEAEMTEEHPKYYNRFKIIYSFKGKDLSLNKIEKAVSLSQDRYCGVSEMFRAKATIEHEIIIED